MSFMANQNIATNEEDSFLFALQLSSALVLPVAMQVAIELDVFEIIAKAGPDAQLSSKHIASYLPTTNENVADMLDRILRLLTSYSVLTSSLVTHDNGLVERLYGLAPVCKYFIQNVDGVSLSPLLLLNQDKVYTESWYHFKDAVLEGGSPFMKAHGMHTFDYLERDPRANQVFNRAMFNQTTIFVTKLLEIYKGFEDCQKIVDVGGGFGITLSQITTKYPTIKGINFDLPHVIEHAPFYPGVEHVGGNMFDSVPNGETIFMKGILHDWNDESCTKLLKNCYKALPDNGKLIVVEAILPVEAETNTAAKALCQFDICMMSYCPEGKERTKEEFVALAKGAGFASMEQVCSVYDCWVMEFYKR
ncbi:hypothetical protein AQUCO_01500181v1 [Aquilegia coerulea]|uniref:O-methyltransferase domain-containing protein n=1 Tax=Aquilegia coerulea TaxID=218851 RepID=A0A2G5DSG0_AQUCA|nr:hypothetical protein AQUCO_01500181v1 [Aquilegia coerulea]